MKITLISNTAFNIYNFRKEFVQELVKEGHEVSVIIPKGESGVHLITKLGVHVETFRLNRKKVNPFQDFRAWIDLVRKIRRIKPDITISYTIKPVIYGSLAAKLAGVKKIFSNITGLGYVFIGEDWKTKLIRRVFVRALYKVALVTNYRIFFQNIDDKNMFLRLGLVTTDQCVLINGSGVNLDRFNIDAPIEKKVGSFLFVGRILKDKGVMELLEAGEILKKKYPHVKIRLIGDFDQNPASLQLKDLQPYIDNEIIEYLGRKEDVRPFLQESEVFVLPSYREGTPRSTLEAMASGLPVVTTCVAGCRETVVEGENGFLVNVRDPQDLALGMEKFLLNPQLSLEMGAKSLEMAKERYDVHKVNASIINGLLS